jgi:hypothetical protein
MPDFASAAPSSLARGVFVAPGPTRRTIRVMTSGYVNNDAFGQAVVLTAARP